jgi:hypothetical protein
LNLPLALLNVAVMVVPVLVAWAYSIKKPRAVLSSIVPFPAIIAGLDIVAVEKEFAGIVPAMGQKSIHTHTRLLAGMDAFCHSTLKVTCRVE